MSPPLLGTAARLVIGGGLIYAAMHPALTLPVLIGLFYALWCELRDIKMVLEQPPIVVLQNPEQIARTLH